MKHIVYMSLLWLIIVLSSVIELKAQVVCTYTASNDLCQNAQPISDIPISTSSCCGNLEGVNLCALTETGVWYYYSQSLSASLIEIVNVSISGPLNVEFYSGSCGNLTLISKSDCAGFSNREFEVPNCTGDLFIHISTTEQGCGEFSIRAEDIQGCDFADNCSDISAAQILQPVANGSQVCVSSCMEYSCISTCTDASVWFRFDTDDLTTAVSLIINDADFNPLISIYRGVNCFDLDELMVCSQVNPGEFIDLAVTPDFTYFVEVSLESGQPGEFDLCINAIQDFIECSSGELIITRPENPMASPEGPFCPGETVLFCYDLEFFVDRPDVGNGCQWLQGIVPILGGGWDLNANNLQSQNPTNWMWFDDVDYNVNSPVLGLVTDGGGNTILEYGPGGLKSGDVLPGGWYFVSNGTNIGCTNDGHPDNMWGVNTPCGQVFSFSHCFELTARSVNDIADCQDDYIRDLSVTIFNFADGETGCYTSLACSGDTPVRFEGQLDCSSLVEIVADGAQICSGEFAEIPVYVEGGYEIPLMVEVVNDGNTSGAQDWVFETGSGLIPDQIINNGNSVETVTYQVSFYEPETDCNIPTDTFDVLVYPEFSINMPTEHTICQGDTKLLSAPAGHDDYAWYNAETNDFILASRHLNVTEAGYYRVEVTEGICVATEIVHVIVNEPLPNALDITELYVCDNYIGTFPTSLNLEQYQLNGVLGNWYNHNDQLIANPSAVDFTGYSSGTYNFRFETTNASNPCPNESYDVDIIVEECRCPEIDIVAPPNFCNVAQFFDLNTINNSSDPGTWSISAGPSLNFISIVNDELRITNNTVGGLYSLSYTLDDQNLAPLCSPEETVQFFVLSEPEASIQPTFTACNVYTGTEPEVVDLDNLHLSGSNGVWTSVDASITIDGDNQVNFAGVDPGDYTFNYTTNTASAPCVDQQYQSIITVLDCSCPDLEILPIADLCSEVTTLNLDDYKGTSEMGEWSLVSGPNLASVSIINDELIIDDSSVPGLYTLRYTLTVTDIPPLCDTYTEGNFIINEPVSVTINPAVDICNINTGTLDTSLDLDDLIQTSNSGVWTSDVAGVIINGDNRVEFAGMDAQDVTFRFNTDDALSPCTNEEFVTVISVLDCSCPDVGLLPIDDICISDNLVDLSAFRSTSEAGVWSIESGPDVASVELNNEEIQIRPSSVAGEYILRYTLSASDIPPLCADYSEISLTLNPPVDVVIEPAIDICNINTGTLDTSLDLDDLIQTSNSGVWTSDVAGVIIDVDNRVEFAGMDAQDITFRFNTDDALSPCTNEEFVTVVSVLDCSCPDVGLLPVDDICISDNLIDLSAFRSTTEAGVWSIESGPDVASVELNNEEIQIRPSSVAGEYILRYTLSASDIPSLCADYSEISLTLNPPVDVVIEPAIDICNINTGTLDTSLDLDDLIQTSNSGVWTSDLAGVIIDGDNRVEFAGMDAQDVTFRFNTDDALAPCTNEEFVTVVSVLDCSCPDVGLLPIDDICTSDNLIDISAFRSTTEAGVWSIESGPDVASIELNNEEMQIRPSSVAGEYILRYTLSASDIPPLCADYSEVSLTLNPPVEVVIEPAIDICNINTGTLDTSLDLDDLIQTSNSGVWTSDLAGVIIDGDNRVEFAGMDAQDVTFRFNTDDALAPCTNEEFVTVVSILDCSCPDVGLLPVDDICIASLQLDLSDYRTTSEAGQWSIVSGPDLGSISLSSELLMIDDNSEEGTYQLRYTLSASDIPPLCDTYSEVSLNLVSPVDVQITPLAEACSVFTGTMPTSIDLDDLIITQNSGRWTTDNPDVVIDSDNTVDFTGVSPQDILFEYTTDDALIPCQNEVFETLITVTDCSCPSVAISPLGDQCLDDLEIILSDLLVTQEPGVWSVVNGPNVSSIGLSGDRLQIFNSTESGNYTIRYTLDDDQLPQLCDSYSELTFAIVDPVDVQIEPVREVCNSFIGTLDTLIDLDDLISTANDGIWTSNVSSIVIDADNKVDFKGITPQDVEFTFTTSDAVAPCPDESFVTIVTVNDCSCPTLELQAIEDQCVSDIMINLETYLNSSENGLWTIVAGPDVSSLGIDQSELNISDSTVPGDYTLRFTIENPNIGPLCKDSDEINLKISSAPEAVILSSGQVCNEFTGTLSETIDLDDYFVNGADGEWSTIESGVQVDSDNIVEFISKEIKDYVFVYTTNTAETPCVDQQYQLVIELLDCSCPDISISPLGDLCLEEQSIDLNDLKITSEPGSWSLTGGPDLTSIELTGSQMEISDLTEAGLYTLTFELSTNDLGPLCPKSQSIDFRVIAPPVADILENFLACNEATGGEVTRLDLDDVNKSMSQGSWTVQGHNLNIDQDNIVSFEGETPGAYEFIFTTDEAIDPCTEESYTLTVTVQDCSCPSIVIDEPEDFCQEDMQYDLNQLIVDAEPGTWRLVAGLGSAPEINNNMLLISANTEPGNYQLMYELIDSNVPPDCESETMVQFEVFTQPEAQINNYIELCNNYIGSLETELDLDDMFLSGDSGEWISVDANVIIDENNEVVFDGVSAGDYGFVYKTNTAEWPCEDVEYDLIVRVIDCVCPVIELAQLPNLCEDTQFLNLEDYLNSENSGQWTIGPAGSETMISIDSQNELTWDNSIVPGAYSLTFTFDDTDIPSLCETSAVSQFEIIAAPQFELIQGTIACNAADSGFAEVEIDLDELVNGDDGVWSSQSGMINIDTDNNVNFEGVDPGVYIFEYTSQSATDPCEEITEELSINVANCECPVIAFLPAPEYCNEATTISLDALLANGVDPGSWSFVQGPQNVILNQDELNLDNIQAGEYEFEFRLDQSVPTGCLESDRIVITVNAQVELQVQPNAEVCDQSSSIAPECINLNDYVSGSDGSWLAPGNYSGDFSDVTQVCFTGMTPGDIFIFNYKTNTAIEPCADKEQELRVVVRDCACPDITLETPPAYCNDESAVDLNQFKTNGTVDGNWSQIAGPSNLTISNGEVVINNIAPGEYEFEYTPDDLPPASCPQTNQISLVVSDYMQAGTGDRLAYCVGEDEAILFYAVLQNEDFGGVWTDISVEPVDPNYFDQDQAILYTETLDVGTYVFEYSVSPDAPCAPSSSQIEIIIHEIPVADAGMDNELLCNQRFVELGGNGMSEGSDLSYEWMNLSTGEILNNSGIRVQVDEEGEYQVTVRNTVSGCSSSDIVFIENNIEEIYFDAEPLDFDCDDPGEGVIMIYNAEGGDGNYRFSIDGGASWTPEYMFDKLSPGNYTIIMQDGNDCEFVMQDLRINGPVTLNVWAGEDAVIEYGDELYPLQVMTDASEEEIDSIIWEQDGEVICAGDMDDCYYIEVDVFKESTVCVTVIDINGCSDSDCVYLEEKIEVNIYMANVFTPDSYSNNDMFFVQTNEFVTSVRLFRVYDRWGGMIFDGREEHEPNDRDEGWDGTFLDKVVQPGVYTFHVVVVDVFGEEHKIAGDVTLLR